VFYASAAGNSGAEAWQDAFRPVTATVGGISGTFANFNAGGGSPNVLQTFSLPPGQEMILSFEWDNAYKEGGGGQPNFQVTADMDVLITDPTGATLAQPPFSTPNLASNEAVEVVDFVNNSTTASQFAMAFQLAGGTAPNVLKWIEQSGPDIGAQG